MTEGQIQRAIVTVPWPPSALRPNKSRQGNWWEKFRAAKTYRIGCRWEARAAGLCQIEAESLPVKITFHPPDNRRRDRDNMIAALKSGQDGIADVLGVDDSLWVPTYAVGEPVKRGRVVFDFGDVRTRDSGGRA